MAARLGVALIGTGGLLVRAKRLGLVREVRPVLEAMRSEGYRLSEELVAGILRLAGEKPAEDGSAS